MGICLRIIDALAGAYRNVEEKWCVWLKLIVAPMVLYMLCMGLGSLEIVSGVAGAFVGLFFSLLAIVFPPMLLVNLYRYGILGEFKDTWLNVRFDKPVWRVLLYTFLIMLIVAAAAGIVGGVYYFLEDIVATAIAGIIVGVLFLYFSFRCIVLLLPAVAIGEKHPFKKVFEITSGNVMYIFYAYIALITTYLTIFVLAGVPFGVAGAVLSSLFFISEGMATLVLSLLGTAYLVVCMLYITAVSAKLFSIVYLDCEKTTKK